MIYGYARRVTGGGVARIKRSYIAYRVPVIPSPFRRGRPRTSAFVP